jgi:hypothetical protein
MKNFPKLLIVALITLVAFSSQAQKKTLSVIAAEDTLTNAGTSNLTLSAPGAKASISFQLIVTKIDGAVAGTASLEGSHDGTNYAAISGTTFTLTNVAAQTAIWTVAPSSVPYYRIKIVGSGTQRCIPTATAIIR